MQEIILAEFIYARLHAGPVGVLAHIQEIILRSYFSRAFCQILGEIRFKCKCPPCLYTPPAWVQEKTFEELLMYWFRAKGLLSGFSLVFWSWEPATGPRTPKKIKVAQSRSKVTTKVIFLTRKETKKWPFRVKKVTFSVTFELLLGEPPPKVTFQSLLSYFDFGRFGGL